MPEKSINEIARPLRELYDQKGLVALQRNNLDYAIAIFTQILDKEPAFYDCRAALRAAQFKKAGGKTGFFKRVLGTASSSPMLAKGQLLLRSNPIEAIRIAEQILNNDPDFVPAHKLLAEAALEADMPKTAVLSLEIALKTSPKDKEIALRLGEALARAGEVARAEALYTDLQRAHPADNTIAQALKDLSARRTMSEGGYDALAGGQGSYRDILKNEAEAIALEQESRETKSEDVISRLIEEYETRLQTEPQNLKLRRSLGELYAQRKDFDRALACFQEITAVQGTNDPSLERAISDIRVKQYEQAIQRSDPNSPEGAAEIARLKAEKEAFQLSEAQKRVDRYPNDLQLRYELAQLYFEAGKLTEAIAEFQRAQHNPHRRIAALTGLSRCFARRGMNDLAVRTLQTALKEKQIFDEEKKELLYLLGSVLENMGKREEAIEYLKQIYEVDIGYRDVAAKVDAYYQGAS